MDLQDTNSVNLKLTNSKVLNLQLMNKTSLFLLSILTCLLFVNYQLKSQPANPQTSESSSAITLPSLLVNGESTHRIAKAFRIALGDITGNIQHHQSGQLTQKVPCLYAGLVYGKPWTRDAAINVWNGFGLLAPEISKNTLLAQTEIDANGRSIIGGQYWDKIIWAIGAWNYYLYSGDQDFLTFAYETTDNTLYQLQQEEYSTETGLFRGPAVYGDGVAAYPVIYSRHQSDEKSGSYSGIEQWPEANQDLKYPSGQGIPMQTLSTNAVYYQVFVLLQKMEKAMGRPTNQLWEIWHQSLRSSINLQLWNETKGNYNYLIDPFGGSDAQEGMGIAFALMFGIANEEQAGQIFETTVVEPAGIPCVYPSFPRYRIDTLDSYGRHSGTVWPHIQGFWADAAMQFGQTDIFLHEFNALTDHATRDYQFVEIYHPTKGTAYGGLQEPHLKNQTEWFCGERQSWSATAYLRMILFNIMGMDISETGISFQPFLPPGVEDISILGLRYRDMIIDIHISKGNGGQELFTIDGRLDKNGILSSIGTGRKVIEIKLR